MPILDIPAIDLMFASIIFLTNTLSRFNGWLASTYARLE